MHDSILRNVSLITYLFLLFYFFSSWSIKLSPNKKSKKMIWLVVIGLIIISSTLADFLIINRNSPFINLLLSTSLIYSVARIRNIPSLDALIWSVLLLVTNLICEIVALNLTQILTKTNTTTYSNPSFAIISIGLTMLLGILAVIFLKRLIIKRQSIKLSVSLTSLFFLVSVPLLSIILLLDVFDQKQNQILTETSIIVSVIILNSAVMFFYKITIDHQNKLHQMAINRTILDSEQQLLKEMNKNRQNVLKLKHDLKNQYLVVLGLLNNSEIPAAQEYIKTSLQILEPPAKLYTTNRVLNYLLTEKLSPAIECGIVVEHQLFISETIKLNHDILAVIIGNILDNAIQASLRIKNDDKKINLLIKQSQDKLIIEISNKFNLSELETRASRKNEGLGIKNIESLVQEIGGLYRHWQEADFYFVTIVLFNIYNK